MGSLLCCLLYPEDGSAAPPVCCFCLPWPFPYYGVNSVCFYHLLQIFWSRQQKLFVPNATGYLPSFLFAFSAA